jgi:hypothetical protein
MDGLDEGFDGRLRMATRRRRHLAQTPLARLLPVAAKEVLVHAAAGIPQPGS